MNWKEVIDKYVDLQRQLRALRDIQGSEDAQADVIAQIANIKELYDKVQEDIRIAQEEQEENTNKKKEKLNHILNQF